MAPPHSESAPLNAPPSIDRFIGALLGGAIGDALGFPCEGLTPDAIKSRYGQVRDYLQLVRGCAQISDDTQLTLRVVECLVLHGFLEPADLARRFIRWLPEGRGKGAATVEAVTRLQKETPWYVAGSNSAGNGSPMRSAPIGLVRWDDPVLLRIEATLSSLPTHRHPMAIAGAVAMAAATAFLVARESSWPETEFISAVQQSILGIETEGLAERRDPTVFSTLHDRIGEIPDLLSEPPRKVFDRLYNGAYVLESLPAALYCFLRARDDVEQIFDIAVNQGYDADTVAAMAGTLAGAWGGTDALPGRLVERVEYRDELRALAERLYFLALNGDSTRSLKSRDFQSWPQVANSDLVPERIPGPDVEWNEEFIAFALSFDGYSFWGSSTYSVQIATECSSVLKARGAQALTLTELRTLLFVVQRCLRWAEQDNTIGPAEMVGAGEVVAAIRHHVERGC